MDHGIPGHAGRITASVVSLERLGGTRPRTYPANFDAIPDAAEWLQAQGIAAAAAFVWFIGTAHGDQRQQVLALSADGHLWRAGRKEVNLAEAYRATGSSLTSLVVNVVSDLLP
jgi:type III secretion system-like peptide-binding chaperone